MTCLTRTPKNTCVTLKTQQGASLLSLLFFGALIMILTLFSIRAVPVYLEFMSVKKVLRTMQQDSLQTMSAKEIRAAFDRRASLEYIHGVSGSDLEIERTDSGETIVTVEYQVVKPLIANVSVLLEFSARSDGG